MFYPARDTFELTKIKNKIFFLIKCVEGTFVPQIRVVYSFPIAAVTTTTNLMVTQIYSLRVQEVRSPK